MAVSLLNLISTPVPVLNSLGLNLRVGLSSDDPMAVRHQSETYEAYLTVYSPEGVYLERKQLGHIPPHRRRFFDVGAITRDVAPSLDYLTVVHRVPSRLLAQVSSVEDEVESVEERDYQMYRSLVEYSYPGGGNGSVVYETPPGINSAARSRQSSNTLTFTCQTVTSETLTTCVVLINYSVDPGYSNVAAYEYALYGLSGEQAATGHLSIGPFGVGIIDVAAVVPPEAAERERDPRLGLSTFNFVGYSNSASLQALFLNIDPSVGAVAVEHTHSAQVYVLPIDDSKRRGIKGDAQRAWQAILTGPGEAGHGR